MSFTGILIIALLVITATAIIVALYYGSQAKMQKEITEANKTLAKNLATAAANHEAEVKRSQELAKKTGEINANQVENHNNASSFDGSIDVLSNIAAKRADGNN